MIAILERKPGPSLIIIYKYSVFSKAFVLDNTYELLKTCDLYNLLRKLCISLL